MLVQRTKQFRQDAWETLVFALRKAFLAHLAHALRVHSQAPLQFIALAVGALLFHPSGTADEYKVARFQLAADASVSSVPLQTNVTLRVTLGTRESDASWVKVDPADLNFGDGSPVLPEVYKVTQWKSEDGLPSNRIQSLLQSSEGYLWIGTAEGLLRFDGREFRSFNSSNTKAFRETGQSVGTIVEDSDGTIWMATAHGLLRMRGGDIEPILGTKRELIGKIGSLSARSAGGVWVGTDQGLWMYEDANGIKGLGESHRIASIGEASKEVLYLCMPHRTSRFNPSQNTAPEVLYSNTLPATNDAGIFGGASSLRLDAAKNVYLGCEHAILQLNHTQNSWTQLAGPFGPNGDKDTNHTLRLFAPFKSAIAVVSGKNREVSLWRSGARVRFVTDTGAKITDVQCLTTDRDGNLWVGTVNAGLIRLRRQPIATLLIQEPDGHQRVQSITEGADGSLWCATRNGVIQWGANSARIFEFGVTAAREGVNAVWRVPSGMVWAAFGNEGIVQLASGFGMVLMENQATQYAPGERSYSISGTARALYSTRNRHFWLGTKKGLFRGNEHFSTHHGLPHPDVRSIFEDSTGNLWIGTYGGGICRMRDQYAPPGTAELFEVFDHRNGLSQKVATGFYQDADRTLWLATEGGLVRFKQGKFFEYTAKHGLSTGAINQILEDDNARLWLGTNRGLLWVERESLNQVADGTSDSVQPYHYGRADGMLNQETNGESSPSGCKAMDGRLYFPTMEGVVCVDPRLIHHSRVNPIPRIIEVMADGEPVFFDGLIKSNSVTSPARKGLPLEFKPGKARSVDFRFSAIEISDPDLVRLEYKLEGLAPDWRPGSGARVASYTNLKPGNYRFLVRASVPGLNQKASEAVLPFRVAPHFWQTLPFYLLCTFGALAVGAGLLAYRLQLQRRIHMLEQRNALDQERARISRDMHDQLGAKLSKMALNSDRSPVAQAEVRETLRELRELIWSVNPKNDTLSGLAEFLSKAARHYLGAANIRVELDFPNPIPETELSSATRHHVASAFQEALRNVIQHAQASTVRISMRVGSTFIRLEIADDGKGFRAVPPPSHGNGLANLRHRMKEINGDCFLSSDPGNGARVEFLIPLHRQ